MERTAQQGGSIANAVKENAVKTTDPKAQLTLKDHVNNMGEAIKKALPSVITPDRFTRIVLTALSNNPALRECTTNSFLAGMMQAAQLGLEPNTPLGHAYLIPYKNNKKGVVECQFQIGYKGLIDLAYRSGNVSTIEANVVCEKDMFVYAYGLNPRLEFEEAEGERGKPVKVYALVRLTNGGYIFKVQSIASIRRHAEKYSKSYESGPWQTNFEEMALKTVLKQVLKHSPLRSDFARAVEADETVKNVVDTEDMSIIPADYSVVENEKEAV